MPRLAPSLALLLTPIVLAAQEPQGTAGARTRKTPIPAADWSRFEVLGASVISADGKWVAYELRRHGMRGESGGRVDAWGRSAPGPNSEHKRFADAGKP